MTATVGLRRPWLSIGKGEIADDGTAGIHQLEPLAGGVEAAGEFSRNGQTSAVSELKGGEVSHQQHAGTGEHEAAREGVVEIETDA